MSKPPASKVDEHALALGHVILAWANTERLLDWLLADLLYTRTTQDANGNSVHDSLSSTISRCVAANTEFRDKIQLIIALSFLRKVNDKWFDQLKLCLDDINNNLRNERNRMLHDHWLAGPVNIRVRTQGTKIRKPQAFLRELIMHEIKAMDADDIWDFVATIKNRTESLFELYREFVLHNYSASP